MKTVRLPYGETWIELNLPENLYTQILTPRPAEAIPGPLQALAESTRNPIATQSLEELATDSHSPCIVISDSTRPTPSGEITRVALDTLNNAGIPDDRVKVVIATGLHRPCTPDELTGMLGRDLLSRVTLHSHDARDQNSHVYLGDTQRGTPVHVDRVVVDSDLIIGDGYIEPHFFAGYTGGAKNIVPGVSGLETIKANHSAAMIDHPNARAGVLDGNPIYHDVVEGAKMAGYDFSFNVTLNHSKQVSGVFTGGFEEAHRAGCRFLDEKVKVKCEPADIVITTNGGYPLDRDLYQAVKGMTVGEAAVKEGGVIIVASECRDGVGHPDFMKLVVESETPQEVLDTIRSPGFFLIDQWEAQTLARVQLKATVITVTGVDAETTRKMHLTHARDVDEALRLALEQSGRDPTVTVIPGGPSTIPEAS